MSNIYGIENIRHEKLKIFLWIFVLAVMQFALSGYIHIFLPGALLVFSLCYALLGGRLEIAVSVICGATADALGGGIFGIYTLLYLYVALLAVGIKKILYCSNRAVDLLIIFFLTLLLESAGYFFNIGFLEKSGYVSALKNTIFPNALCNSILALVICPFIKRTVCRRWADGRYK